jgi:(1->4)-alpha-D-glucan 1-alpha-D-glucosylmutase
VGAWPITQERLSAYMKKAVREAKEQTSWIHPNAPYGEALERFIAELSTDAEFLTDLEAFLVPLIEPARVHSLALNLLKLTAPGIPDLYQGTELRDLSLVDPDNRRPVDYELRRRLLSELDGLCPEKVAARSDEGLPKLFMIRQALRTRLARGPIVHRDAGRLGCALRCDV